MCPWCRTAFHRVDQLDSLLTPPVSPLYTRTTLYTLYTPPSCKRLHSPLEHKVRFEQFVSNGQPCICSFTLTSPPSHHPHIQHYPQSSSELTKHIPLKKVPPLYSGRCAALSLDIIIGAGIGGLAATHALAHAKHRITLLESASVLSAGIQVSPNAVRLLHHWGLGRALAEVAVGSIDMIRVPAIGYTRWDTRMVEYHGYLYDLTNQNVYLRRKGYPVRQPLKNHPA